MAELTYPRIAKLVKTNNKKMVKKSETGKPITIPGQAMSLKDIIARTIKGFPVPMARGEIQLHPDINQVLKGEDLKIVSDVQFMKMTKQERASYMNNIAGLKQKLSERMNTEIAKANELKIKAEAQEAAAAALKAAQEEQQAAQ